MQPLLTVLAALCLLPACSPPPGESSDAKSSTRAQTSTQDSIPVEVRRRIAQAIWPENLFDSAGRPERGFVRRIFGPAFEDLKIRQVEAPAELAAVRLFVGTASLDCTHCGTVTRVVAEHADSFVTLLEPHDVAELARWAPPATLQDTTRLRSFVISALRATCFLGCEIEQLHRRADLSEASSLFLRPAQGGRASWRMPRTYSWQKDGGAIVEFALHSPGRELYGVRADGNGGDSTCRSSPSPSCGSEVPTRPA